MVFQLARGTAPHIAIQTGELLPHLLTLTLSGGYFLLPYFALTDSFPLGNAMLCVARTFLFLPEGSQRQTGLLYQVAKIRFLIRS